MKRLLNRRDFFRCMGGVMAALVLPVVLPEIEPEVIGVDVGAEGGDATVMSLHRTDDLGGFSVSYEPSPVSFPADSNLQELVNNFKRVHQDFAQFLIKEGAV